MIKESMIENNLNRISPTKHSVPKNQKPVVQKQKQSAAKGSLTTKKNSIGPPTKSYLYSVGTRSPIPTLAKKKQSDMNFEHDDTSEKKQNIEMRSKKGKAEKSPFSNSA